MSFNNNEMAAIVNIGKLMAKSDGNFSDAEVQNLLSFTSNFDLAEVEDIADSMSGNQAASVLAAMPADKKFYVCCYLAELMAVDGEIADEEVKLWQAVSYLADFPAMTIREALNSNYRKL